MNSLSALAVPLPEDIEKAKWCGDFARAQRLIEGHLQDSRTPACVRRRLEWEREILVRLPLDYIYTEEEGLALIRKDIPDFTGEEFQALEDAGAVDWIYIGGRPTLSRRFYETLLRVHPDLAARAGIQDEDSQAERALLEENIRSMHEQGGARWHIRMKAFLQIADSAFRPGETLRVHLPLPAAAMNMRDIHILACSPEAVHLSPEEAPQRTAYFECAPRENLPFTVEYEYDSVVNYTHLDPALVSAEQPSFDTEELLPHIRFTPFLRELCAELKGDETNPLIVARKFYDYCTTAVTYSYMREYFTITQIPEYAGLNRKGDCGVQALLFITLCRCAGIPARWQSGLFVTPYSQGCHDWAQFYAAPYGWLFADPSFGGSGYRAGNTARHDHYFGSLDPFRMVANSCFQAELEPAKRRLRCDPYDNQRGEAEYADRGLLWNELEASWEIVEMKKLG